VDTLDVIVYGLGGGAYYINGHLGESATPCIYNGHPDMGPAIILAVIDSATCQPWSNDHVDHGQLNQYFPELAITTCRPRPENYFIYPFNDPASFTRLYHWIRDSVPNGEYLLFYSWTTYSYSNSPPALDSLFSELSFYQWPVPDSVPFIFFCKKGNPSLNVESQGVLPSDTISIHTTFTCLAVGISEIDKVNDGVSIYPNPVLDNFTITLNKQVHNGELKIYDVNQLSIINCQLPVCTGSLFFRGDDGW
jgi:hypothetical protein